MGNLFKQKTILAVLILAASLRLWNLTGNPPGLTWDEAALGYNAYSILQTARDEYGNLLPLQLKSFGDYKPALYAYSLIPSIVILGLNEWSVRIPSAIFGVLTVLILYLLVWELFKDWRLAILSSLMLAISPWHLQFSRAGFEANMALMLNILGAYLFILGSKRSRWFVFSALVFGLSLFTYQASRMFVPLIVMSLTVLFKEKINFKQKQVIGAVLVIGFFVILLFWNLFFQEQNNRLEAMNFFAYRRSEGLIQTIYKEDGLSVNSLKFQILHGEWWSYTKGIAERYLIYFSPKTLFIEGDYNHRSSVPDLGITYYFSLILIPLGIFYLLKFGGRSSQIIFLWLLLAPLPAVFSRDLISILRALNMVIPVSFLEASGLFFILNYFRNFNRLVATFFMVALIAVMSTNIVIYFDRYYIHMTKEYSEDWLYGYANLFKYFNQRVNLSSYKNVVITDTYGQPYIYYLFYSKYPPADFQKQAVLDQPTVDVGTVRKIDNIEFRHIEWPLDRGKAGELFVGTPMEIPEQDVVPFSEFNIKREIDFLDNKLAFRVVEIQK